MGSLLQTQEGPGVSVSANVPADELQMFSAVVQKHNFPRAVECILRSAAVTILLKSTEFDSSACPLSTLPAGLGKLGLETVECSQAGVAQDVCPV